MMHPENKRSMEIKPRPVVARTKLRRDPVAALLESSIKRSFFIALKLLAPRHYRNACVSSGGTFGIIGTARLLSGSMADH